MIGHLRQCLFGRGIQNQNAKHKLLLLFKDVWSLSSAQNQRENSTDPNGIWPNRSSNGLAKNLSRKQYFWPHCWISSLTISHGPKININYNPLLITIVSILLSIKHALNSTLGSCLDQGHPPGMIIKGGHNHKIKVLGGPLHLGNRQTFMCLSWTTSL